MKSRLPIIFIIIACIAGAAFYEKEKLYQFISPKTHTSIEVALQKTKEIDKLYTGVYLIPVLDLQMGTLKRDMLTNLFSDNEKKVVKAYCLKKYEVSVGYDDITALLSDSEVIKNACAGNTDKLPDPQILAVNPRETTATRDYKGDGMCYRLDSLEEQRRNVIRTAMQDAHILDNINERGRESLKTLATIFCE